MKCYSNRLLSIKEIDDYLKSLDDMYALAKVVVKNLGLWYDNLENVVDTYVLSWLNMGFEISAIETLSNYAFRSNIRTLENFNNTINNLFKIGILTSASVDSYLNDIVKIDGVIANILAELGIDRGVIASDRNMYKTWLYSWNITEEVLWFGVSISKGKYSAMQYLNRVLAEYHTNNISTEDDAKKHKLSFVSNSVTGKENTNPKSAKKREYSKKELDSLFDDITEIEI